MSSKEQQIFQLKASVITIQPAQSLNRTTPTFRII